MPEAICALLGTVVGSAITAAVNLKLSREQHKQQKELIWGKIRYEALRRIAGLMDRAILFQQNSKFAKESGNTVIDEYEKTDTDSDDEWNKICELRDEVVLDMKILFDHETVKKFTYLFELINEGAFTIKESGIKKTIREKENEFIQDVKKKYLTEETKESKK